jgi:hypothetical protein
LKTEEVDDFDLLSTQYSWIILWIK